MWAYRGGNIEEAVIGQYRLNPAGNACGGNHRVDAESFGIVQDLEDRRSVSCSMAPGALEGLKNAISD